MSNARNADHLSIIIGVLPRGEKNFRFAQDHQKAECGMRKTGSNGPETLRNLRSAAIQLLSERSYEGMNLRLLAGRLRLQAGSLYNYIDSKQQLLFWLMKDATEKLLKEFDATIAGVEDPEEQMLRFVAFHVAHHIVNRKEASVLLTEMHSLTRGNYRAIKQLQRLYTDKVYAIIERGSAAGKFSVNDLRIATFVLLQALTSVARWYHPRGRLTVDELVDVYTELVFAMLGANTRAVAAKRRKGSSSGKPLSKIGIGPIGHSLDIANHALRLSAAPSVKMTRPKNRHGKAFDQRSDMLAPTSP